MSVPPFSSVSPNPIKNGTWAERPISPDVDQQYFATDIGTGVMVIWNGTKWKPVTGSATLHNSGAKSNVVTGTTAETNIGIIPIPAGLVSATGALRISAVAGAVGTAGTKDIFVYLSSISGANNGTQISFVRLQTTDLSFGLSRLIANRSAQNSQITMFYINAGIGNAQGASTTTAINLAAEAYLNVTAQLSDGSDSAYIDLFTVEWLED